MNLVRFLNRQSKDRVRPAGGRPLRQPFLPGGPGRRCPARSPSETPGQGRDRHKDLIADAACPLPKRSPYFVPWTRAPVAPPMSPLPESCYLEQQLTPGYGDRLGPILRKTTRAVRWSSHSTGGLRREYLPAGTRRLPLVLRRDLRAPPWRGTFARPYRQHATPVGEDRA